MPRGLGKFVIADKIDGVWTDIDPTGGTYDIYIEGSTYAMDELLLWAPADGSYFLFATADSGRHTSCIQKYTFSTDSWTTMVGQCNSQGNYDHTDGLLAKFRNPNDIAVNADHTLAYIADYGNHRLRLWNMVTNEVTGAEYGPQSGTLSCQICTGSLFGSYGPSTVQYTPDYSHLIVGRKYNSASSQLFSVDMTTYVVTTLDINWKYVTQLSFCRLATNPFTLVNRYSEVRKVEFASSIPTCASCPAETPSSPAGSTPVDACFSGCDPGQAFDQQNVCQNCLQGQYQPNSGHTGACIDCPAYSFSQYASDEATDCTCNKGYTGPNGGTCTACSFGTYKDVMGTADCISCADNSFSKLASGCECNKGYSGPDGGPCVA